MKAKQLSVFIENRQGRLQEVLKVLKDNNVNILSLSLADTTEFGLLRVIVNDYKTAKDELSKNGFSATLTDVLIIEISHKSGSLQNLLEVLDDKNINIEYMYGLSTKDTQATVVLKCSDLLVCEETLEKHGIKTLSVEDIVNK